MNASTRLRTPQMHGLTVPEARAYLREHFTDLAPGGVCRCEYREGVGEPWDAGAIRRELVRAGFEPGRPARRGGLLVVEGRKPHQAAT